MDKRLILFFTLSLFIFSVVGFSKVLAIDFYLDAHTNNTVLPDQNITVWGGVYNYSNTSDGIEGFVVTANLSTGANGTSTTGSDGNFSILLNTTGLAGENTATVSSNFTTKTVNFRVSNMSTLTIEFVENLPPFNVGGTIITKITSTDTNKADQTINGTIFASDGKKPSGWGTNTSTTNDNGIAYLNFSIPSTASAGRYVLSVENGAGYAFFIIKKYTVSVKTKDTAGAAKAVFSPGDNVTVETKIVDSNGNLRNVTSVACDVIDENNTLTSITGTIISDGKYQCNHTTSGTGQSYDVKVTATDGSITEIVYTKFATQAFSVRLAPKTGDFFRDFGGKKSFTIGQTLQMNIIPTNVSNGEMLTSGTDFYCNTTSITIWDVFFASNGTSVNGSVSSDTLNSGMYMMTSGCYYEFDLGQITGIFGIKVNVTVGSQTITGQGYFSINKYLLKVESATMFGGMDFNVLLKPEENATFKLSVYNLSSGAEMGIGNISYAKLNRITPLSFTGTMTELSTDNVDYSFINGSDTKYLNVVLPSNTGPMLLTALATVSGENVTGDAFYFAKYIMGFATPSGSMWEEGGGGGGGPEEDMGGGEGSPMGGTIACSAGKKVQFSAQTMDASTMQAVKGVTFHGILEAREEETGKDVSSCFTTTKATSNNQGSATFNVTFGSSCTDLSGPYFIMFNISWKNNTDSIPAFFMCKNLNFWATAEPWDAQSNSVITIQVTNASYAGNASRIVTGGNISITRLFNFNPSTGGQALSIVPTQILSNISWTTNVYNGTIQIHPANFSSSGTTLTKWPNGFFDGRIKICDNATGGVCDTNFFGFSIQPYRVYTTWWKTGEGGLQTYTAGTVVNTTVFAQTNVSAPVNSTGDYNLTHQNITSHPGFIIKIMSPKSQSKLDVTDLTVTNATNDNDNWDKDNGWGKYNISFTLPSTITKGWWMGFITVNNTDGEQVDLFVDFQIKSYTVGIPHKESLQGGTNAICCDAFGFNNSITNASGDSGADSDCDETGEIIQTSNWTATNWTHIRDNYGIDPDQDGEICVHKHFNLSAEDPNSGAQPSSNTDYGALVFGNSTHKMLFVKNVSDDIIQINVGDLVPGTKQYLMMIEGPWYAVFINATSTATRSNSGLIQEDWGWAGQFKVNESFKVPFIVIKNNQPQQGVNVTIENMVELETEGFGVKGMFDSAYYNVSPDGSSGNITDSNGIAFVPLKVSQIGKFKPFWKLNSTASDVGGFDKSPVIDVRAFNAYGQMITFLPQTTKVITLYLNTSPTYGTGYDTEVSSKYYNGSFTETAGNEFYIDYELNTWYFLLANATTIYNKIIIDNDTTIDGNYCDDLNLGTSSDWQAVIGQGANAKEIGIAGYSINTSGSNRANFSFYSMPTNTDQFDISAGNEKVGIRLCAQNLQYRPLNATINLTWVNWMSTMGMPVARAVALYNISTGEQMSKINTSNLNNGCVYADIRPKDGNGDVTTWENGMTEVQGTVSELNTTGDETGNQQSIWVGQVRFWSGNY